MITYECKSCGHKFNSQFRTCACFECSSIDIRMIDNGRIGCSECGKYQALLGRLNQSSNVWDKQMVPQVEADFTAHITACH